ncbi:MAG: response regulator transcription factor [Firmicutes bacterium]|nr:response regulator transcription factor [Bacillota bacterium]
MPIRTLIVDDYELVRFGIKAVLATDDNFAVVGEAADGRSALALVERLRPEVVLLDPGLPDLPGAEVCRAICRQHPSAAVVVLSPSTDEELALSCLEAGARAFLVKDIRGADLRRSLEAAARGEVVLDPRVAGYLVARVRRGDDAQPQETEKPLNRQQLAVIRLVAQGRTNREIAAALGLSEKTVKGYLAEAMRRLGVKNRVEAAMLASRRGWV